MGDASAGRGRSTATNRRDSLSPDSATDECKICPGNTKGGSITVPLTSCLTSLDQSVLAIKTKNVSCHRADSKPVKQGVNCTVILPSLVFPDLSYPPVCLSRFLLVCVCVCAQKKPHIYHGILKGKYHCTIDLLFDWFGLVCFANKNKKLSIVIQLIPSQSNRRSMVQ